MMKRNKGKLIASSLLILLPILLGLLLWNKLPEHMTTHWGADGVADGGMARPLAVFLLPCILLAVHWLCLFVTSLDKASATQNPKMLGIVFWILPVISCYAGCLTYAFALGYEFSIGAGLLAVCGIAFILIGNYLPKCRQSVTMGIKLPWTLANEENWNATHRFGGKMWVIGGLLLLPCGLVPVRFAVWILLGAVLVLTLVPTLYSYGYYRRQVAEGRAPAKVPFPAKMPKWACVLTAILLIATLTFCGVISFTGNVKVHYGDTAFTLEASYYDDLTVSYDSIDSLEYRESGDAASRVYGFGSPRLSLGHFESEEFGSHTRYTYTGNKAHIVLISGDRVLVLNGPDAHSTRAIYEALSERIGG